MPDHFHGLLRLNNSPPDDLSKMMKFVKGQSGRMINKHLYPSHFKMQELAPENYH